MGTIAKFCFYRSLSPQLFIIGMQIWMIPDKIIVLGVGIVKRNIDVVAIGPEIKRNFDIGVLCK